MDNIIAQLFAARDIAHAIHLRTRSFSQHLALGEFYENIVGLTDRLAESYQGRYGPLDIRLTTDVPFSTVDAVSFITSVSVWATETVKPTLPTDSFLLNQWDEILTLVNLTKYKLERLA